MFKSAGRALAIIFEPALFGVVIKSFALSFLIFVVLFVGAEYGLQHLPAVQWHWLNVMLQLVVPVLVIVLAFVLGAPVAAIFASLYLNRIAATVEAKYYAADAPSKGAAFVASVAVVLRVLAWLAVFTLALLPVDVTIPIIGSLVALVANGWLLGREYFELTALRHLPSDRVESLRRRHGAAILGAGLILAALAEIPIVNFIAPLYGVAFMVHVFKHIQHREGLA